MYGETVVACVVALLTAVAGGGACEDGAFRPLEAAKTSARWARDGFTMSVSGDPDKYIPRSMYIGKRRATFDPNSKADISGRHRQITGRNGAREFPFFAVSTTVFRAPFFFIIYESASVLPPR